MKKYLIIFVLWILSIMLMGISGQMGLGNIGLLLWVVENILLGYLLIKPIIALFGLISPKKQKSTSKHVSSLQNESASTKQVIFENDDYIGILTKVDKRKIQSGGEGY